MTSYMALPLREWRLRKLMTFRQLSDKAKVSTETLQRAEKGGRVHDVTARRVAAALEVDWRQIVEFYQDPALTAMLDESEDRAEREGTYKANPDGSPSDVHAPPRVAVPA